MNKTSHLVSVVSSFCGRRCHRGRVGVRRYLSTSKIKKQHPAVSEEAVSAFTSLLGKQNVSTAIAVREQHGRDESWHHCVPADAVLWPENVEQLSEIAKICHKNRYPMIPFGTGTGLEGGITAGQGMVTIDLSKMDQITDFHPEDFDICVQPGVTRNTLNEFVKDQGLWFPIDPGADASLCGMAATSASGTNAVRYGTMRENIMNLEIVLADGTIIDTAGKDRRTKKTSAGYNLTNLLIGSEGTLGFISKATLRLHGIPETMVSAVCSFDTVQSAVETVTQVMQCGVPIARIEFLDDVMMDACNKFSGLDHPVAPTLFLEFQGSSAGINAQVELVGELAQMNNGSNFQWAEQQEDRNKLWKARHNVWYAGLALRPGSKGLATDVCVPISRLPSVIVETKEDLKQCSFIGTIVGHVGDGNFHTIVVFDPDSPEELEQVRGFNERLVRRALDAQGTCTGEHGVGLGKREFLVEEVGEPAINTMRMIKRAFDPLNLMNPGKVLLPE